MTDTHCHLDDERYAEDLPDVLARSRAAGVRAMVTIGCDLATSRRAVALAEAQPDIWAAVGLHPSDCGSAAAGDLDEIARLARHPRVVAIGECGLDFFRAATPVPAQEEAFRRQIALAIEVGKPLVIHCREAFAPVREILASTRAREVGGVMHCWSGEAGEIAGFADLGFFIALGGTTTFPKNDRGRESARQVPLDRLVFETDAPYLAPQRFRGQRNEPAHVAETARFVASERGMTFADVEASSDDNARRLFALALPARHP